MAKHNEQLAQQVLAALEARFPEAVVSEKFKASEFANTSVEEWQLVLQALYVSGLVEGKPYPNSSEMFFILNLRITPLGRETLIPAVTWKSFYLNWFNGFGKEFTEKRKGKLLSSGTGAIAGFLAGLSSEAWLNWKTTVAGTLLGIGAGTFYDFLRVPWLMHKEPPGRSGQHQQNIFTIIGLTIFTVMVSSIVFISMPLWMPKHKTYEIEPNNEYASLVNAQHSFKGLSVQLPNCKLRLTAPQENEHVAAILRNVAGDFCKLEEPPNPSNGDIDFMKGSEPDTVIIHVSNIVSPKDEIRDGQLTSLQNLLSVKIKHDLAPGSPPECIWLQIGRGYPWRKHY